ncbi:hypothetical protein HYC85_000133 [Camellia sinensis]|uniref:Uncharacterized protein n=1 Tax=Camellia sinensis TaxID=4442 RepID=A0A7J7I3C0_CAMSI|nr:hypothetical protein HYC85_000133 [Camellia sinensis]
MVYDASTYDDLDDEPNYRPERRNSKGKQFHSPYDDKESYLNPKGKRYWKNG